jgi:glyoxylase-like metal-dependent hydrolase (beta-lactamase superfamily II)
MNAPTLFAPTEVAPDTFSLNAWMPLPGFGVLAINAFLLKSQQPVLIDTGLGGLRSDFIEKLGELIDPSELRWIWITHADADHVGNLGALLDIAPNARVVTTFLGMGKMGMQGLPVERCYLLNPGESLDVGDRELRAVSPATFDAPETTALFDTSARTLFSADSFGALLGEPAENAGAIAPDALKQGMMGWAQVDAPWLQTVDAQKFARTLAPLRELQPETLLSSHLPPADRGMIDTLFENLSAAPDAPRFVGPNQAELEQMMAATQPA